MTLASRDTASPPTGQSAAPPPSPRPYSATLLACFDHPHVAGPAHIDSDGLPVVAPKTATGATLTAREWLRNRRSIAAGEAVTLLTPLLGALIHLERSDLDGRLDVVSSLTLADVLLDAQGTPVWAGLRALPSSSAERSDVALAVAAKLVDEVLAATTGGDTVARAALESLCRRMPGRGARPAGAGATLAPTGETDGDRGGLSSVDEVIEAVLDLAPAAALATHGAAERAGVGAGRRIEATASGRVGVDESVGGSSLPADFTVRGLVRRVVGALRDVRPRVWLLAGGVAASIVVSSLVLGGPPARTPVASQSTRPGPSEPSPTAGTTIPRGTPAPTGAATPTGTATSAGTAAPTAAAGGAEQAVAGDDPAAAVGVLLAARARCLRELDGDCLSEVDQEGSPGLQEDLAAIGGPDRLGDVPVDVARASLVNRLGDAALFSASELRAGNDRPATVLLIKTEAGWRLRDVSLAGGSG